MSKTRLRLITIISLAVLFVFTLGLAIGMLPARKTAGAATYAPTAIFTAGNADGTVGSNRPSEGASETEKYYIEFTFANEGSVTYRRDLALKWFEQPEAEESDPDTDTDTDGDEPAATAETVRRANPAEARYFSMTFAFETLNFESFDIVFEGAEENISKDAQATNTLHFIYKNAALSVSVRDSSFDEEDETATEDEQFVMLNYTAGKDITISFGEYDETGAALRAGEFAVTLAMDGEEYAVGTFTNIGGYFLEYRSTAATTPQTPMTFTANLADEESELKMLMKSLNGQSFEVGESGVTDNAKPVLVLSEAVYSFRLGQRFSLTYEAIDVCDDSVSVTRSYYMATKDDKGIYKKPSETTSNDYKTLTTSTFFMPTSDDHDDEAFVSIRFKLDDGTHSNYYVYLTWYAADVNDNSIVRTLGGEDGFEAYYTCPTCDKHYTAAEYNALGDACTGTTENSDGEEVACTGKKTDIKLVESNAFDYIVVDLEAKGPSYIGLVADEETKTNVGETEKDAYQAEVNKAAANVSAGKGAYIYLPSLRSLISSGYADYRNLRFSIYYFKPGASAGSSATSATSLRYNNLRFEVDEVGEYRFRVIAQDASSNAMKYYDEDGDLVTVTSSNVWDIDGIPEFTFYVDYDGPSIEEAGTQDPGYRDRSYSIPSFDIIALDGYKTEYTLYYLNEDLLNAEGVSAPDYSALVKDLDNWIEKINELDAKRIAENPNAAKILREINKYNSEITEDDEAWTSTDNDYHWNPDSSLSFIPQVKGTYFVKVDVTDAYLVSVTTSAYMAIDIGNPSDQIPGRSQWLQNNVAAVVLFSISAVLLVAIIVLFVVKPADKTVEEVDLETLKGKKEKKSKKD